MNVVIKRLTFISDRLFPVHFSILCYSFIDSISLLTWMKNKDLSMSLGLVYHIAYDVITTLEFLHQNGINHNDITPPNILLTHRPGVSII